MVKEFKISASKCSEIMGKKGLGKTGENFLKTWYLSKKYNRKKEFFSKFVDKGLMVEDKGIEMLSTIQGIELSKNDKWFEDEFMGGFPDVIHNGIVFDIKSAWSIFTFPFYEKGLFS